MMRHLKLIPQSFLYPIIIFYQFLAIIFHSTTTVSLVNIQLSVKEVINPSRFSAQFTYSMQKTQFVKDILIALIFSYLPAATNNNSEVVYCCQDGTGTYEKWVPRATVI